MTILLRLNYNEAALVTTLLAAAVNDDPGFTSLSNIDTALIIHQNILNAIQSNYQAPTFLFADAHNDLEKMQATRQALSTEQPKPGLKQ